MKYFVIIIFCLTTYSGCWAQDMDKDKLKLIIAKNTTINSEEGNTLQFTFKETTMVLVYDLNANRMRIITPVVKSDKLKKSELTKLLEANYHSALDAKYALYNGYVWSTFIHPLAELEEEQLVDAIYQVRNLVLTYGTYYSSTGLSFGK